MKQIIKHISRHPSVRLLLTVSLGFVILTASANLPDFSKAMAKFGNTDIDFSLIDEGSVQVPSSDSNPVLSSGAALGWGAKSDVLP